MRGRGNAARFRCGKLGGEVVTNWCVTLFALSASTSFFVISYGLACQPKKKKNVTSTF